MHENAFIQMVAVDFFGKQEREPSISRTYITLYVLNYKKAR